MALLGKTRTAAAPGVLHVSLAGLLVGLISCAYFRGDEPLRPGFNHQLHYEEGLDCSDCHLGAEDSDEPGLPSRAACYLCHDEDEDLEKPQGQRVSALFDGETLRATGAASLADEVLFSHAAHVAVVEDCAACHGKMEESTHPATYQAVTMDDCMACHEAQGAPNECATCHSEVGTDWQPPSHRQNWLRVHGPISRSASSRLVDDCSICHTQDSCEDCHFTVLPDNHTNFWRSRGHGVTARLDRETCAACHQSDICQRCHEESVPMSHRSGAFGGRRSNHCFGCHFPLGSTGCATCHQDTPSHRQGTPIPPDHTPSADCRACHGVDAALPHADNGTTCLLCHG